MRSLLFAAVALLGLAAPAVAGGPSVVVVPNAAVGVNVAVPTVVQQRVLVRRGLFGRRVVVRNRNVLVNTPATVVAVNGFVPNAVQFNRFSAFGTNTFVDGFGNVFVIDAFGNTRFVGNAFNRGFGPQLAVPFVIRGCR